MRRNLPVDNPTDGSFSRTERAVLPPVAGQRMVGIFPPRRRTGRRRGPLAVIPQRERLGEEKKVGFLRLKITGLPFRPGRDASGRRRNANWFQDGAGGNQPDPLFGLPDPVDRSFGFRALHLIFAFFKKFLKPGSPPAPRPPAHNIRWFSRKFKGVVFWKILRGSFRLFASLFGRYCGFFGPRTGAGLLPPAVPPFLVCPIPVFRQEGALYAHLPVPLL